MESKNCNALADLWLPAATSNRKNPPSGRLVIFPYAGSGAAPWFKWCNNYPDDIEVRVVRLPGRETRLSERPIEDPNSVLVYLSKALSALSELPTVYLGHSLGVSFASILASRMSPPVKAIVVSGALPPNKPVNRAPVSHLQTQELLHFCKTRWGGVPQEVIQQSEYFTDFIRCLRADLALSEHWPTIAPFKLACPCLLLTANNDPEVDETSALQWQAICDGPFKHLTHSGDHMSILDDQSLSQRVLAMCRESLLS